ncbi:MAG TPA: gas vesicle protein GvpO [Gaiellaceae bacterium]
MPATHEAKKRAATGGKTSRGDSANDEKGSADTTESSPGGGRGTAGLVLAGAGAGALVGTVRALKKRRRAQQGDESNREEPPAGGDDRRAPDEQSGSSSDSTGASNESSNGGGTVRGMAITLLEAALDGLKDAGSDERDEGDGSTSAADEEDEEAEPQPRDEQDEADPPASRGKARSGGDDGEKTDAADSEPDDDAQWDEADADDDEEPGSKDDEDGEDEDEEDHAPGSEDRAERRGRDDERGDDAGHAGNDVAAARSNGSRGAGGSPDVELVRRARDQLAQLVGREAESVSHVERRDDGWQLALEVVELERIPHSTDVLASYEVSLDADGRLLEYSRARRYVRSRGDEESG